MKIFDFFPFGRTLKQNLYFDFNPVNNEEKNGTERLFCSPTMLQSVAWLSFSVFDGSLKLKIENWNQFSIFVFRPEQSKSLTELPQREREGSISTVIFLPPAPFPQSSLPYLFNEAVLEVKLSLHGLSRRLGTFCKFCAFSSLSSVPYGEQRDLRREPRRKKSLSFRN